MKIVLVYVLCILMVAAIPKRRVYYVFLLNSILIAYLAYKVSVENQYDLIFHLDLYGNLMGRSIGYVVSHYYFAQSPLYVLYVYFLSIFKDAHLLPAVSTFIGYFSFSNILYHFIKNEAITKEKYVVIYMLVLFVLPWQDFAAGIRGALGFTVCSWAVYTDFIKSKKKLALLFYVSAIFIHQSAIIALLIRVIWHITNRMNSNQFGFVCILALLFGAFSEAIGEVATLVANMTGLRILSVVARSFSSHTDGGNALYELGPVIVRVAVMLMVLYIIKRCGAELSRRDLIARNIGLLRYYTLFVCITLGYIWQYDIICRYSVASVLLLPMVLSCSGEAPIKYQAGRLVDRSLAVLIIPVAVFILTYHYVIYYSKWSFGG